MVGKAWWQVTLCLLKKQREVYAAPQFTFCFFYVSLCLGPWDGAPYIQGRSSFLSQSSLETQTYPEVRCLGVSQAHQVDSIDM